MGTPNRNKRTDGRTDVQTGGLTYQSHTLFKGGIMTRESHCSFVMSGIGRILTKHHTLNVF